MQLIEWKFLQSFKNLRELSIFIEGHLECNDLNDYLPNLEHLESLEVIHPLNFALVKDRAVIKACIQLKTLKKVSLHFGSDFSVNEIIRICEKKPRGFELKVVFNS